MLGFSRGPLGIRRRLGLFKECRGLLVVAEEFESRQMRTSRPSRAVSCVGVSGPLESRAKGVGLD